MNADLTLDITEPQVLIHFDQDPNQFYEHHRVLLKKLQPGRWVALTPDHELEVVDLNVRRHHVLARRAAFPPHLVNNTYSFDPLTRNELEAFKRQARTMAIVLGDEEIKEVELRVWVFADHTSSKFGATVDRAEVDRAVVLGSRGLVDLDGSIELIEEIDQKDLGTFKETKQGSLGDLRTIGQHEDSQQKRFIAFQDAHPLLRETSFKDWAFSGPRATREFLASILESGTDIGNYHHQWVKSSGVNMHSSVVHEHRNLVEMIRLGLCKDQLDLSNLMSFELGVRRLVQLEVAVQRSPHSPDYSGLDVLLENPLNESGGASTRLLDNWITDRLKEKAQIAKQNRLYKEEVSLSSKPKAATDGDAVGAGQWRKRRKPKSKASPGPGGSGAGES